MGRASAKYLFVNNIADCADEIHVHAAFEKYNLMDVYLPRSHETGAASRSFCYYFHHIITRLPNP